MDISDTFKYCPRCAAAGLAVERQRLICCRHCGFTYYHNTAAAVAAIIEHDSKILLTKRAKDPHAGLLDLPGGFVDFAETAEDALKREVREELNINIVELDYFTSAPNLYHYRDIDYRILDLLYICAAEDLSNIRTGDEIRSVEFYPPTKIPFDQIAFESTKTGLRRYVDGAGNSDANI